MGNKGSNNNRTANTTMIVKLNKDYGLQTRWTRTPAGNTRLAQWGLMWLIESLSFNCKFMLADSLVFQNPPLRQAWER